MAQGCRKEVKKALLIVKTGDKEEFIVNRVQHRNENAIMHLESTMLVCCSCVLESMSIGLKQVR